MSGKSILLVFFQFVILGLLIYSSGIPQTPIAIALELIAIIIGFTAIWSMKVSSLKIFPEPNQKATLVTKGLYGHIRHPMYLAVIVFSLGLLFDEFAFWKLILVVMLIDVMLMKMRYEEKLLSNHFSDYTSYKLQTKKLIPFIY